MTAPDLTSWGERLRERTEPLQPPDVDADVGYVHALLAGALAVALERTAEIYDPEDGAPGSPLLDVDRCPDWALPWLAQLVGVTIPPGMDPDLARAGIRDVAGWKRGTPAALAAAAGFHLTGDKTVYFRERDPTGADPPYTLEVVTLASETPDPAAVLAELMRQKPAGLVLVYRTVAGLDWQQTVADNATWVDVGAKYATWRTLVYDEPI